MENRPFLVEDTFEIESKSLGLLVVPLFEVPKDFQETEAQFEIHRPDGTKHECTGLLKLSRFRLVSGSGNYRVQLCFPGSEKGDIPAGSELISDSKLFRSLVVEA